MAKNRNAGQKRFVHRPGDGWKLTDQAVFGCLPRLRHVLQKSKMLGGCIQAQGIHQDKNQFLHKDWPFRK